MDTHHKGAFVVGSDIVSELPLWEAQRLVVSTIIEHYLSIQQAAILNRPTGPLARSQLLQSFHTEPKLPVKARSSV